MYDKDKFRLIFKSLGFKVDRKDPDVYSRGKAVFELRDTMVRYYIKGGDEQSERITGSNIEKLYDTILEKFKDKIRGSKLDNLFDDPDC